MIALWGAASDIDPANDADQATGDHLPDDVEAGLVAGHAYDNTKIATYNDIYGYGVGWDDCEDYCLRRQTAWTNGSADSVDWANPGHQY